MDFVRYHGFAISRTAKNKAAFAFATRDRFGCRPDEEGIIHRIFAKRTKIFYFVTKRSQQLLHFFLVLKTGVICAERNLHGCFVNCETSLCRDNMSILPTVQLRNLVPNLALALRKFFRNLDLSDNVEISAASGRTGKAAFTQPKSLAALRTGRNLQTNRSFQG